MRNRVGVRPDPVRMQGRVGIDETSRRHADTLGPESDLPGELSTALAPHTTGPGRQFDDPALWCRSALGVVGSAGAAGLERPDHLIAGLGDRSGQGGLLLAGALDQGVGRVHGLLGDLGGGEEPDGGGFGHLVGP